MRAPRGTSLLGAAGLALLGASAALAAPAVDRGAVTAESGVVKARVTFTKLIPDPGPRHPQPVTPGGARAEQLTITRGGATSYQAPIASADCSPCGLEEFASAPPPLAVDDLEGDGEPAVIVHLYTGGAHCCTIVQIFTYDAAAATYRKLERDFGDPGASVADVAGDGHLELRSADDRFAYEFAPYAYSGLPLQIWRVQAGRLVDATRSFPAALAADGARWLKIFRQTRRRGRGTGVIAAWAADEELLGHGALVRRSLAREAARGNLRSREHYGPSGRRFAIALMRFLERLGYAARAR